MTADSLPDLQRRCSRLERIAAKLILQQQAALRQIDSLASQLLIQQEAIDEILVADDDDGEDWKRGA